MSKKYRARWVKRRTEPHVDSVVATGRLTSRFERTSLVRASMSFEANESINLAQLSVTADGGYARVKDTDCWIPISLFGNSLVMLTAEAKDYKSKQSAYESRVSLKTTLGPDTLNSVAPNADVSVPSKTKTTNPKLAPARSKKDTHMDKKELKTLLATLGKTHIGEEIEVNFRASSKNQSGKYRLLETKVGRGKGGSMLARVESVTSGHTMTFGTPNSEELLNIVWRDANGNANLSGYADESAVPAEFVHDATNAVALKASFEGLIGKTNIPVKVDASDASFAGSHQLLSAKRMAGRFGQIRLELSREDGSKFEIWSYRHSGVVKSVQA